LLSASSGFAFSSGFDGTVEVLGSSDLGVDGLTSSLPAVDGRSEDDEEEEDEDDWVDVETGDSVLFSSGFGASIETASRLCLAFPCCWLACFCVPVWLLELLSFWRDSSDSETAGMITGLNLSCSSIFFASSETFSSFGSAASSEDLVFSTTSGANLCGSAWSGFSSAFSDFFSVLGASIGFGSSGRLSTLLGGR